MDSVSEVWPPDFPQAHKHKNNQHTTRFIPKKLGGPAGERQAATLPRLFGSGNTVDEEDARFVWRMATVAVILVLAGLFALLSCGTDRGPFLVDHPGYPVYRKYCRRCHGDAGDALKASRIAHRHVDLGSAAFSDTTDADEVRSVILDGKGRMKGYRGRLDGKDLDAVAGYVLALPEARRAVQNH